MDRLATHFSLLDSGGDEPGDWMPFPAAYVLEGELWEEPHWQNRWRRLAHDPERGVLLDLEVHVKGDRVRLRMPVRFDRLPDEGKVRIEPALEGGFRRRWFEQVGDETHMVSETIK